MRRGAVTRSIPRIKYRMLINKAEGDNYIISSTYFVQQFDKQSNLFD